MNVTDLVGRFLGTQHDHAARPSVRTLEE